MKKLCLVIHSLGIGGMERVMVQLANYFSEKEGVTVHLILIGRKRNIDYHLPNSVVVHTPSFTFDSSYRLYHTVRTGIFLRNTIKKIEPDTILSFGEYWNNLVLLSLTGLAYPIFISDRSEPAKNLGLLQNYLRNSLYPKAAGYIAQTQQAKNVCFLKGWNNNIKVIGNPIRQVPNEDLKRENIILTVGRLIKTKHVDHLINIFADINQPEWKLVIVGGNAKKMPILEELKTLVCERGLEDKVFLKGEQKNVDQYYNRSKIFAFTSSSEGYPNVIGEALSSGLPVVAYDCVAGPSEMIKDGKNGFLVPLFNRQFFRERLLQLMEDGTLRDQMSNSARKSITENSIEKVGELFYNFITSEKKREEHLSKVGL